MDVNLSVWDTYLPEYVHPDFVPYLRYDSLDGLTTYNSWSLQGNPNGLYSPGQVRKGWGQAFQLLHPDDPCPNGTIKDPKTGWCYPEQPENIPIFYSKDAFVPKRQFWNSYVSQPSRDSEKFQPRISSNFDMRSINPYNGKYMVYFNSKTDDSYGRYGKNPTSDLYLL